MVLLPACVYDLKGLIISFSHLGAFRGRDEGRKAGSGVSQSTGGGAAAEQVLSFTPKKGSGAAALGSALWGLEWL